MLTAPASPLVVIAIMIIALGFAPAPGFAQSASAA